VDERRLSRRRALRRERAAAIVRIERGLLAGFQNRERLSGRGDRLARDLDFSARRAHRAGGGANAARYGSGSICANNSLGATPDAGRYEVRTRAHLRCNDHGRLRSYP
jgi:hypothetical protein